MCNDHIICMHIDGVNSNGKWRMNLFGVFAHFHFTKYGTCRLHKLYNRNKYCMNNICTIFSIFLRMLLCVVRLFTIIPAASNKTNANINTTHWLWWRQWRWRRCWWCWWRQQSQKRIKIAKSDVLEWYREILSELELSLIKMDFLRIYKGVREAFVAFEMSEKSCSAFRLREYFEIYHTYFLIHWKFEPCLLQWIACAYGAFNFNVIQ